MRNEKQIQQILSQTPELNAPDGLLEKLQADINLTKTDSASAEQNIWRMIMKNRITKLAAAIAIIIALLIGLQFMDTSDISSVAFAEVLQYIQTYSYTFDLTTITEENASGTVTVKMFEPGKMRMDATGGLGKVSSITDLKKGKTLILFHQFKTGQIIDINALARGHQTGGIFAMLNKPVANLWGLEDGTQEQLDDEIIDGRTAAVFVVFSHDKDIDYETTIWADTQTGLPILVEMIISSTEDPSQKAEYIMENFDLDVELDEDLFTLDMPQGYILAYQKDLDTLQAKTERSNQAEKIVQALELFSQGSKQQAINILITIDWSSPVEFGKEPYLFTISEQEYVSLKPRDQQQVMTKVMADARTVRMITKELLAIADATADHQISEQYLTAALQLGNLLTRNPEHLLIARLVGIAIQRKTLEPMIALYTETGQQDKLQQAQKDLNAAQTAQQEIKDKAAGL